jgi:hypothetical protein
MYIHTDMYQFFSVLGIELRVLHTVGTYSSTEPYSQSGLYFLNIYIHAGEYLLFSRDLMGTLY